MPPKKWSRTWPCCPWRVPAFRAGPGALKIDADFRAQGEDRGAPFTLLLAEFTDIDPPFDAAAAAGARFVAITEARDLGHAEREALRLAYSHLLG